MIEIAIVQFALVADTERGAAHEAVHGGGVEGVGEEFEIGVPLAVLAEVFGEARDRLVGDREEAVEHDAELLLELGVVVGLELGLRAGKFRAEGIVNEVQRQARAVADGVELLQRADAFGEHAVAALLVHIFRRVARQRRDDLDLVAGEIVGQPAEVRLFDDGEIVAVDHARAGGAAGLDEEAEMFAQLGRAAGEVHDGGTMLLNPVADAARDAGAHHFGAPGRGIDVAMAAGLVALAADVDLQRLEPRAGEREAVGAEFGVEAVHSGNTGRVGHKEAQKAQKEL